MRIVPEVKPLKKQNLGDELGLHELDELVLRQEPELRELTDILYIPVPICKSVAVT